MWQRSGLEREASRDGSWLARRGGLASGQPLSLLWGLWTTLVGAAGAGGEVSGLRNETGRTGKLPEEPQQGWVAGQINDREMQGVE